MLRQHRLRAIGPEETGSSGLNAAFIAGNSRGVTQDLPDLRTPAPAPPPEAAEDFAEQVLTAFESVYHRFFRGDPVANPRLRVETVAPAVVLDTMTVVLVTPWTLNGLFCPPSTAVPPEWLDVSGRPRRVFPGQIEGVGRYLSVHLLPDVSHLQSPQQVRTMAAAFAGPFGASVRQWRTEDR